MLYLLLIVAIFCMNIGVSIVLHLKFTFSVWASISPMLRSVEAYARISPTGLMCMHQVINLLHFIIYIKKKTCLIAKLDMFFRLIPPVLVFITGYWAPFDLNFQAQTNPRPRAVGFTIAYRVCTPLFVTPYLIFLI